MLFFQKGSIASVDIATKTHPPERGKERLGCLRQMYANYGRPPNDQMCEIATLNHRQILGGGLRFIGVSCRYADGSVGRANSAVFLL